MPSAAHTPTEACQEKVRRSPVCLLSRSQHRGGSARLPGPDDPQDQAGGRDDSQPRGGEFAVEAPEIAEVETAVQLIDPGPQRQGT
jgi:hypothetical protein